MLHCGHSLCHTLLHVQVYAAIEEGVVRGEHGMGHSLHPTIAEAVDNQGKGQQSLPQKERALLKEDRDTKLNFYSQIPRVTVSLTSAAKVQRAMTRVIHAPIIRPIRLIQKLDKTGGAQNAMWTMEHSVNLLKQDKICEKIKRCPTTPE